MSITTSNVDSSGNQVVYQFTYSIIDPCLSASIVLLGVSPLPVPDWTVNVLHGVTESYTVDITTTVSDSYSESTGIPNSCGPIEMVLISTQFPTAGATPSATS